MYSPSSVTPPRPPTSARVALPIALFSAKLAAKGTPKRNAAMASELSKPLPPRPVPPSAAPAKVASAVPQAVQTGSRVTNAAVPAATRISAPRPTFMRR